MGANNKNHSNRHIICHGKLAKSALSFKQDQYASPDDNYCNEDEIPMEDRVDNNNNQQFTHKK